MHEFVARYWAIVSHTLLSKAPGVSDLTAVLKGQDAERRSNRFGQRNSNSCG